MPELVFVGTGDAFGSGGRRNSAILVRNGSHTLLLDCGPSTLSGLKELGIDPLEVDAVAITHYHGDHCGGLPFLLLDHHYERPRERPLTVLGPPGIAERTDAMSALFHYAPASEYRFELRFREFSPGTTLEAAGMKVEPLPAHHHPDTKPHMLRVRSGGRSIFFTGDTGWHEGLPGAVGDADLFVCECVFMEEKFEYHLSHERLDRERARFTCARTILTHMGRNVLDELGSVRFDAAEDGLRVTL
jgi:ribonuclease BN (tRNA processing enzyme)